MGQAKKKMMEEEEKMHNNAELENFFKVQLGKETLSGVIEGIAKQLTTKGADSLSEKQKVAIQSYLEKYKSRINCDKCMNGNVSSLSDYLFIEDNEYDLCPLCEYDREKLMND